MAAVKYPLGIPNIPGKTLVGNLLDSNAPPTALDIADVLQITGGTVVEVLAANKTLTLADQGKIFRVDANTAYAVTVPSSLPVGFNVAIAQWGTQAATITAGSGATNRSAVTATTGQYKMVSIIVLKNNVGLTAAEYIAGEV